MMLPALLYVTYLPAGSNIQGLGISAALASSLGAREGAALGVTLGVLGAWLLFKTQLDLTEALVRAITDILWTGSRSVRAWRGGDVRAVYYTVLDDRRRMGHLRAPTGSADHPARRSPPTSPASCSSSPRWHLLYINTRYLPAEIRPSRRDSPSSSRCPFSTRSS